MTILDCFKNNFNEEVIEENNFFAENLDPLMYYLCFDNEEVIEENIYDDARKEVKAARKKKTSNLTGTIYKLTPEQKKILFYIKKKYGRKVVKSIKKYRKEFLPLLQIAKTKKTYSSKLNSKETIGMTRDEYISAKKSAEKKIANMRSNAYSDMTKELSDYGEKKIKLNNLDNYLKVNDISEPALNRVFKKYDLFSYKYTDTEMNDIQKSMEKVGKLELELATKLMKDQKISRADFEAIKDAIKEYNDQIRKAPDEDEEEEPKKELKTLDASSKLDNKINNLNVDGETKEKLEEPLTTKTNEKISSKSFEREYENYLIRKQIRKDIRNKVGNKYTEDYNNNLKDIYLNYNEKSRNIVKKMAKERESKNLSELEKKIYELKPGAPKDSDRLSDYVLKIKEDDFDELFGKGYNFSSDDIDEAGKKVEAKTKEFERGILSKMDENDFKLLKKYRLISNLMTIKDSKIKDEE